MPLHCPAWPLLVAHMAGRGSAKPCTDVTKVVYQQIWHGVKLERLADTAAEVGRRKAAYFPGYAAGLRQSAVMANAGGLTG